MIFDTVLGMNVIADNSQLTREPKLRLTYNCGASAHVVHAFNRYLEEMFGYHYTAYRIENHTLVVHPDVMNNLRNIS